MTGFVAFGRVERGRVVAPPRAAPGTRLDVVDDVDEATGQSPQPRIRSRLAAAREHWAMTTFYLFDANSWR